MKIEAFCKLLNKGVAINCKYTDGILAGMINIWKNKDKFVMTWEECPICDQHNENQYTKDLTYNFESVEKIIDFLDSERIDLTRFTV